MNWFLKQDFQTFHGEKKQNKKMIFIIKKIIKNTTKNEKF